MNRTQRRTTEYPIPRSGHYSFLCVAIDDGRNYFADGEYQASRVVG